MTTHYPERLELFVEGIPAPQGSKRHVGGGRMIEMSKKLPAWRKAIEKALQEAAGDDFPTFQPPIRVTAHFYLPRPKRSRYEGPYAAPDVDKLQRALGDCLQRAGIVTDDSHITSWRADKAWSTRTGARIVIEQLTADEAIKEIEALEELTA